jgi:hypothetical protein
VEEILVRCPRCWHLYLDWLRASINPQLDPVLVADREYLEAASTAICAACGAKAAVGDLTLGRELWWADDPVGFPDSAGSSIPGRRTAQSPGLTA